MSAPQLTVYENGGAPATADTLNTMVQSCDTVAQLRGFNGVPGLEVFVRGIAAPQDGGAGLFGWSAASTAPDDGITVIVPYGNTVGAWLRDAGNVLTLDGTEVKNTMAATNTYFLGPQGGQTNYAFGWIVAFAGFFNNMVVLVNPSGSTTASFQLVINGTSITGWNLGFSGSGGQQLFISGRTQAFPAGSNVYIAANVTVGTSLTVAYMLSGFMNA